MKDEKYYVSLVAPDHSLPPFEKEVDTQYDAEELAEKWAEKNREGVRMVSPRKRRTGRVF